MACSKVGSPLPEDEEDEVCAPGWAGAAGAAPACRGSLPLKYFGWCLPCPSPTSFCLVCRFWLVTSKPMMSQKASSDPCSPVVRASFAISSWVSSRPRCWGPLAEGPEPVGVGVAEIGASLASGVVGAGTEGAPFRFLVTVLVLEELEEERGGRRRLWCPFGWALPPSSLPSTSASLSPAVGASVSSWSPVEGRLQARRVPPGLVPLCSAVSLAGFFMKGSRMPLVVALG